MFWGAVVIGVAVAGAGIGLALHGALEVREDLLPDYLAIGAGLAEFLLLLAAVIGGIK